MVLVDTSVWIDHFRRPVRALVRVLEDARVLCHPFVAGELACGSLARRAETLALLDLLPVPPVAEDREVRVLVEAEMLWARGLGWVDVHLLASARLAGVALWTRDRALHAVAQELELAFAER